MRIFCANKQAKGRKKKLEEDNIKLWYLGVCLQRCWHQFDMASAEKVSFFTFLHLGWSVTAFTNFTNSYLLELWVFTYTQANQQSRESMRMNKYNWRGHLEFPANQTFKWCQSQPTFDSQHDTNGGPYFNDVDLRLCDS